MNWLLLATAFAGGIVLGYRLPGWMARWRTFRSRTGPEPGVLKPYDPLQPDDGGRGNP